MGRPTKITPEVQDKIADMLVLAFDDTQIALCCQIDRTVVSRIRRGSVYPAIRRGEMDRELAWRKKIVSGRGYWQGIAWFLERKYPAKFSRPEIQLQVDARAYTQHNATIIIASEVAQDILERTKEVDQRLDKFFEGRTLRNLPPSHNSDAGEHNGTETQG
jgi:hypothetical protein